MTPLIIGLLIGQSIGFLSGIAFHQWRLVRFTKRVHQDVLAEIKKRKQELQE